MCDSTTLFYERLQVAGERGDRVRDTLRKHTILIDLFPSIAVPVPVVLHARERNSLENARIPLSFAFSR